MFQIEYKIQVSWKSTVTVSIAKQNNKVYLQIVKQNKIMSCHRK